MKERPQGDETSHGPCRRCKKHFRADDNQVKCKSQGRTRPADVTENTPLCASVIQDFLQRNLDNLCDSSSEAHVVLRVCVCVCLCVCLTWILPTHTPACNQLVNPQLINPRSPPHFYPDRRRCHRGSCTPGLVSPAFIVSLCFCSSASRHVPLPVQVSLRRLRFRSFLLITFKASLSLAPSYTA